MTQFVLRQSHVTIFTFDMTWLHKSKLEKTCVIFFDSYNDTIYINISNDLLSGSFLIFLVILNQIIEKI